MKEQILNYETPELEIVVVNVEKGYSTTDAGTGEGEIGGGGDTGGF